MGGRLGSYECVCMCVWYREKRRRRRTGAGHRSATAFLLSSLSMHRDRAGDRQVYSIAAAAVSSSSSSSPPWFECSSSANSASIFSLVESIPIMFGGGEKSCCNRTGGERREGERKRLEIATQGYVCYVARRKGKRKVRGTDGDEEGGHVRIPVREAIWVLHAVLFV